MAVSGAGNGIVGLGAAERINGVGFAFGAIAIQGVDGHAGQLEFGHAGFDGLYHGLGRQFAES